MTEAFDVAIVGGGASGVLVAIHLLHLCDDPVRIAIIEPRPGLGQGVAYSTVFAEHRLNVVAARMSAFQGDPGHFVRFLAAADGDGEDPGSALAAEFIARSRFSEYLRNTLEQSPGAGRVTWIRDEALDIVGDGACRIALRSGRELRARRIVLAVGNEARGMPVPVPPAAAAACVDAWDYRSVRGIDPGHDVCIIGSGLSMVDAVASLAAQGHRGRITVLSRHGLLPLPHARPGPVDAGYADGALPPGTRARLRLLRERARAAMRAGRPWQATFDALRPRMQELWREAGEAERRRFLRHAVRFWDIHRHRIDPETAAWFAALRGSGQLDVRAGRLAAIDVAEDACVVRYRPRGQACDEHCVVACVINATGIETALAETRRPLLQRLHARGVLQPGPLGLGILTDDAGAVVDGAGHAAPALLVLGSPRIGTLWESTAIPELRVQAEAIAARLWRELRPAP